MSASDRSRVIVTRSEPGATRSCQALEERGFEAVNAATAVLTSQAITLDLQGVSLIAVTSPFGASCLAKATPERRVPVIAVGDVTAARLRDAGFEKVNSASGDARDLLAMIRERAPEGEVLHVRGVDQTGDLRAELSAKGIRARSEILYAAESVPTLPDTVWTALSEGAPVLIHSAKGAERFAALAQAQGHLDALLHARVIAISSAAAEPLKSLGVAKLKIAKRPDEAALFDALENRPPARA
ncbi:uroporphyrinogen-III synthase [Oceanicaulis sp. LC35]|uniref:uroporphyrinogen-III synthase n=1 Tax=Oceanicaulis sp. LC35 TaxID=3349635 RepID=UPI003F87E29A